MKKRHVWLGGGLCAALVLLVLSAVTYAPISNPKPPAPEPAPTTLLPSGTVVATDDFDEPFFTNTPNNVAPTSKTVAVGSKKQSFYSRQRITPQTDDAYVTINNQTYPLRAYQTLLTPDDPQGTQWWTSSTGLPAAWDSTTGSSDTTIAIIDTGFALDHEEFTNRWYQNPGETGAATSENPSLLNCTDQSIALNQNCNRVDDDLDGIVDNESGPTSYQNPSLLNCSDQVLPLTKDCNNIDDDGNSLVDDVTGWDFINYDRSVQAGQLNPSGNGTTHGTMVAGVAAATGNNGVGLAGVNWQTKILPIQAMDDDSYGDTVSIGQSIYYAIDQGVDVISISLGTLYEDPYVLTAIEAANKAGIVVVAASGNDGCNCVSYPARYPEVVAVGATNTTGALASFSSYGAEIDVVGPGTSIYTTTWTNGNGQNAYVSGVAGTSFATPYVAGLIALQAGQQPDSNPLQLIAALTETTTKSSNMTVTPLDLKYGFGLANAADTVQRMANPVHKTQIYSFLPVQTGGFLTPGNPTEPNGLYNLFQCATPSSPVYELAKGSVKFFSVSKAEVRKAQKLGYSVTHFAYGCLQQQHDTYDIARSINIFREFRNIYSKQLP